MRPREGLADIRDRRRGADRSRVGRSDRRAVAPRAGRQLPRFDPAEARIVLIDGLDSVLPNFPERLRRRAQRDLEKHGVEVRLGTRVVGVDETGLDVGQGPTASRRARRSGQPGSQASSLGRLLAERAGATVDRAGRVAGAARLLAARTPRALRGRRRDGPERPAGLAEVAMQSGHHAARTHRRPSAWSRAEAVPLSRSRHHGHHLPLPGRGDHRTPPAHAASSDG